MKIFILFTFLLFAVTVKVNAQKNTETLKSEAVDHMNKGLYGEAIDLLNKYISARPQKADGYNLRGLCYEKRGQYEFAVYDYRSARKLEPENPEINENLKRTESAWYSLLYNNIEGYKREIAIDPKVPKNYLEIGKAFKNLGEWKKAEQWYDEYLKREEPSPDEVIRYTEILARNNHISKGIPILKKFVEKYPKDQRLWSRYGYFNLWLGKRKAAIKSFENALAIKPYFKEAINGLDQAMGKGYVYTFNDTVSYHNFGMPQRKRIYAIDKYFRILKRNPDDDKTRLKLIDELIKHKRFEEASQQLSILSKNISYFNEFQKYTHILESKKDSVYKNEIEKYKNIIAKDKKAVLKLAEYYANLKEYNNALEVFDNYFKTLPAENTSDVRFKYAQYAAWNNDYEKAINQLNILLNNSPKNIEYQLLRAQIAVWQNKNLDLAEKYLTNILNKEPSNLNALTAMASLKISQSKLTEAKKYLETAKKINPDSKVVAEVQKYYDDGLMNAMEKKIYQILNEARDLFSEKKCAESVNKFEEYFSKVSNPTREEKVEYVNANVCAKKYENSLAAINKLLEEKYDFDLAVLKGKIFLWMGDSLAALNQFEKLTKQEPENYEANLNLAVTYEKLKEFDKAENIYEKMLTQATDSSKINVINKRLGWLPKTQFPVYTAISPLLYYYTDNQDFNLLTSGGKFEVGLTKYLSIGGVYQNHHLKSAASKNLNSIKGQIFVKPNSFVLLNGGFGVLTTSNEDNKNIYDAGINYDQNNFSIGFSFEHNDARLLLYSPFLIKTNLDVDFYKLYFDYLLINRIILSGYFSHVSISDNNDGNNIQARIGYKILKPLSAGYEYYYLNYSKIVSEYYSPKNLNSHSLWIEFEAIQNKKVRLNLGGKVGYIADINFTISEIHSELSYYLLKNLLFNGRLSYGNNFKFNSVYNYFSASASVYWSF